MMDKRRPFLWLLRTLQNLLVGLATAGILLGLLEAALRLAGFEYHAASPIVVWNRKLDQEIEQGKGIHRFHPYWFWELRPGAKVEGYGDCGGERINRAGYRGPARPMSPVPGTMRIVTLGDSSTFGMGVCGDQAYSAVLEQELPGSEVLNFGVIGFSAFQGMKLFEGRAIDYHPRVVLVAFGAVDELLPAVGYDVDAKFEITSHTSPRAIALRDDLHPLRIFQVVERAFATNTEDIMVRPGQVNYERWERGEPGYIRNQNLVSFERSLDAIVGFARSHGALVVLIGPPRRRAVEIRWPQAEEYSEGIQRAAARLSVPFFDVRATFRAVPDSDSSLFLDDYHPNVAGHQIYAKFLADNLERVFGPEIKVSRRP